MGVAPSTFLIELIIREPDTTTNRQSSHDNRREVGQPGGPCLPPSWTARLMSAPRLTTASRNGSPLCSEPSIRAMVREALILLISESLLDPEYQLSHI